MCFCFSAYASSDITAMTSRNSFFLPSLRENGAAAYFTGQTSSSIGTATRMTSSDSGAPSRA
jgi:hypothetical protein